MFNSWGFSEKKKSEIVIGGLEGVIRKLGFALGCTKRSVGRLVLFHCFFLFLLSHYLSHCF